MCLATARMTSNCRKRRNESIHARTVRARQNAIVAARMAAALNQESEKGNKL
jgi:hypothetical protein